ncbi:MAG: class I SAM-dependent methyltransferase [Bacteroidales bacterium]|nr:class I SAM-dependent methyltransferase [Bacteroidales bacterium]
MKKKELQNEFHVFFLGILYSVLKQEGWFDFLKTSRTPNDIMDQFHYSEPELINEILDILVSENIIKKTPRNGYEVINIEHEPVIVKPALFSDTYYNLWKTYGEALPNRLRGNFMKYTQGQNSGNWEDALKSPFYNSMREASFAFVNFKKKPFRLLDVGSGIGASTAQLWNHLYQKQIISEETIIYGLEPDEKFLHIAIHKNIEVLHFFNNKINLDELKKMQDFFPHFKQGSALKIPFDDNTFDYVYTSHMLYLTDPRKALAEILRVTKPNGTIFGTQAFLSKPYTHIWSLFMKVIEGANGYFTKKELAQWAKEAGGKDVAFATPVVFKFRKNSN